MANYRPGRLRRTLAPIVGNVSMFQLYSAPLGTLYDNDIHSVSINRGQSGGRAAGSIPSTLEVDLRGQYSAAVAGNNVRMSMRGPTSEALAAHLGVSAAAIAPRFTGRLGQTTVTDTGKKFSTVYRAASWIAQMNYSPKHYTPLAGQPLSTVLAGLLDAGQPLRGIKPSFYPPFDPMAKNEPAITFKDGITRYATDLGTLLQETRDGQTKGRSIRNRANSARSALAASLPLTRSQAISPATWEQNNERPAVRVQFTVTNAAGAVSTRLAEVENPTGELVETQTVDWTYVRVADVDSDPYREAYARVLSSNIRQFTIPSVTVDLLYLIGSPKQYHRDQAGQLLNLEQGDPVYFSADWPEALRGVHFAEGITETIGPDEWTLELALVPYAQVTGDAPSPVVPPKVWDSAGNSWNNETKRWMDF